MVDNFSYDNTLTRMTDVNFESIQKYPEGFEFAEYVQSTEQAFYFIKEIILENNNPTEHDWILSYCGNVVAGARQYKEGYIDIPVMGYSDNQETINYCQTGDVPKLKLLQHDGIIIDLDGDLPAFSSNGIYIIETLTESNMLPTDYTLENAYPNPFNPTTTISFTLPIDTDVSIAIYDIKGRMIQSLVDDNISAGYHSVYWDGSNFSSGIYFVKMISDNFVETHKLMLIK